MNNSNQTTINSSSLSSNTQQNQTSPALSSNSSSLSTSSTASSSSKHWSQKKHESILDLNKLSQVDLEKLVLTKLHGGSDHGQFVFLTNEFDSSNLNFLTNGKLLPNEILLEIQTNKISGYTLFDVVDLILKLYKSNKTITFRSVKSCSSTQSHNFLPLDLRSYLDARFQKGSIDYDLQQTIRENVYMRTVPCTTRLPRNGEINGQDYIFLSDEQFLELEQNGDLLEYGVYNGHYYGTPKPPKRSIQFTCYSSSSINQSPKVKNDYEQLNDLDSTHKRNNSLNDILNGNNKSYDGTELNSNQIYHHQQQQQPQQQQYNGNHIVDSKNASSDVIVVGYNANSNNDLINEEINQNHAHQTNNQLSNDRSNLINNNNTNSNSRAALLTSSNSKTNNINHLESGVEVIPYGWEKVEDPEYGTFYIDHINKQTTYENPFMIQQQQQQQQQIVSNQKSNMKTFKPSTSSLNTPTTTLTTTNNLDPQEQHQIMQNRRNIYFTQDPHELKGEFIKTSLLKTANGFGFTIIGANETSEDFLQIKYIVPDGAASRDGKLRQGDVLVYVNNECVLGYTHQDVVEIFQSIPIGNLVELTVCRGYPLSIDPNDPNIEIMPLAAINPNHAQQAPLAAVDELTSSTLMNSSSSILNQNQKPIPVQIETNLETRSNGPLSTDEYYCEEYEEMYAPIVKGQDGFGFTIADDAQMNHQKVKQIINRERCVNLQENDILLEINGIDLRNLNHNQVVDILKNCPKGQETIIRLKRRKYQIVLPQPPSNSSLVINNQESKANEPLHEYNGNKVITTTTTTTTTSSNDVTNGEYKEFRPISSLKQANSIFNNANNANTAYSNYNQNQIAFNYERRSKTPSILQSSSSNTNLINLGTRSSMNANHSSTNQPQLRSKTPTTDRILFQHTLAESPQKQNGNDYIYLNGNTNGKNYNINELYSTINRKANQQDQLDNSGKIHQSQIFENQTTTTTPTTKHIPIYDSTTNIQHQRVQQNLNKFQQQVQINPLVTNRSKTPGPEMIYFRNNSNNEPQMNYANFSNTNTNVPNVIHNKSATISNGSNYLSRSKTPTADIMYYPNKQHQPIRSSMNTNLFENIYQPFNNNDIYNGYNSNMPTVEDINFMDYSNEDILQLLKNPNTKSSINITSDVDGSFYVEMIIDLIRQDSGFGFRIVGGEEEGSQVAVGYIVNEGAAHLDGRLRPNDEIIMIDNECVLGATHRRVVQLMTIAGLNRKVKLMIRRKISQEQYSLLINYQQQQLRARQTPVLNQQQNQQFNISPSMANQHQQQQQQQQSKYPYTITLFRNGNEGFGFVIISTLNKNGPSIGKIVENSPAERCNRLNVGDRILAVNGINITQMNHIDIVKLIKESGNSITLTIGSPLVQDEQPYFNENKAMIQNDYGPITNSLSNLKLQNMAENQMNVNNGMMSNRPFMTSPGPQIRQNMPTKAIINQNEFHVIELRKHQSNGFGFSIRGGKEFNIPLYVLKLADYGPAAMDGRLQVGDQILEINGHEAYSMTHSEAIELIKSGGNVVNLVIRRTGMPPPSITDIIAANSTAAVVSAQQQQQQQAQPQLVPSLSTNNLNNDIAVTHQLRSKSPYLNQSYQPQQQHQQTHQVKHFNSSGTLINRNF